MPHILFTAIPAWGHIRPFCILAARLAKENEALTFTLLLPANTMKKAEDEVSSELRENAEVKKRIRIFTCAKASSANPFEAMRDFVAAYPTIYEAIVQGTPVTCAESGTVFDGLDPPEVVIADFFAAQQFTSMKGISGDKIPIFNFITGHAASNIRMFGPEVLGGSGNLSAKMEAMSERLGIPIEAPGEKLYRATLGTSGTIVKLPGVPEMYDYEFYPQILPFEGPLSLVLKGAYEFLKACDGLIAVNAHCWEEDAINALKFWFADWDKKAYAIGPLLPESLGLLEQSPWGADDIKVFLETVQAKRGKGSVLLISFGTTFWPSDPTYLEEIVEALMEKDFPFILCHASPFAKVSDALVNKVKQSGIGLLTKWCPQQYILDHPATGWFLTHCGNNSVTEALGSGVPMIAWPFEADQPATAYQLTSMNLAIELLEVRVGEHAVKPLRRNGKAAKGTREAVGAEIRSVIDLCRGEKGIAMKENAEKMKEEMKKAWSVDGPARKEVNAFLSSYTSLDVSGAVTKDSCWVKSYFKK
ncbi:UDP-Glycosyltransferase/glycogen phosphorylase [Agrocybe pediades]|nr:UDP-Glycosyltransferase/glycogen phosphorylase [Agrocybe pediades]